MKQLSAALCIIMLSVFASLTFAGELPSCNDLTSIANSVDEVAIAFDQAGEITEGDEIDTALRELVKALKEIASIENNAQLTDSVNLLVDSYNDMDKDGFSESLDLISVTLDDLYNRDCG